MKFNLLTIYWFDIKWICLCSIETRTHFGALFYISNVRDTPGGILPNLKMDFDICFLRIFLVWAIRRFEKNEGLD